MLNEIKKEAVALLHSACSKKLDKSEIEKTIEPARSGFGDVASRIAFILSKEEKKNPAQVAAELAGKVGKSKYFSNVEATGPYINLTLSNKAFEFALSKILKQKKKFGQIASTGKQMMVEYFHANTHKGVHIGHIRNISLGESVCRLLEFSGNKVIRANYQGDIGPHVAKCLWGFENLFDSKAPQTKRGVWLGKVYAAASEKIKDNPELEEQVKELNVKLYDRDKLVKPIWEKTRKWCLDDFDSFYKEFGVKYDEFYFESQADSLGKKFSLELLDQGVAKKDQGAIIVDLKDDNLGVFVLLTKEGYSLYSAKDLGLAKLKFEKYDLDRSIHIVGKEQELYFKQLFKTFERAGLKKAAEISYHLIYELVMLPEGKMSSREGTMVLYEDLREKLLTIVRKEIKKRHDDWSAKQVEETALQIALAAIKFTMVRRESNRTLIFDWDAALSLEGDSGPYLQYAYVRTNSILNKADFKPSVADDYEYSENERALIKKLILFPDVVANAAANLAPNTLCSYLLELSSELNRFYTTSRVLNAETEDERETRLSMIQATNLIMNSGLTLLGIECPQKM
jgi:arginyl-tRNA synthetase